MPVAFNQCKQRRELYAAVLRARAVTKEDAIGPKTALGLIAAE